MKLDALVAALLAAAITLLAISPANAKLCTYHGPTCSQQALVEDFYWFSANEPTVFNPQPVAPLALQPVDPNPINDPKVIVGQSLSSLKQ